MKKTIDLLLNGMFIWYGAVGVIWACLITMIDSKTSFLFPTGFMLMSTISVIYSFLDNPFKNEESN